MIKITCAGDGMLLKPFPEGYDFSEISSFINQGDIKAVNLEMVLTEGDCFASSFCGGQWLNSDPSNLDLLAQYGFNMYACANNHSMDYSFDGLLSTCKFLTDRGFAYSGIGKDLSAAEAPTYYEVVQDGNSVKVALISLTTTFVDAARAGYPNQYFPGRPGVNFLRHQDLYYCTSEQMNTLKEIAKSTYINGERDNARKIGSLPPEVEGSLNFGGNFFKSDEERKGKVTTCNENDLHRLLNTIKETASVADYVIVMPHSHQIKHGSYIEPDYFFEDFCRQCIDAGASCVVSGGTHQLKPIEIYNGKPIFYSLGNFIFQLPMVEKLPIDFWEKYNYPEDLSIQEALDTKSKGGTVGLETDINNYLSIIPEMTFEDDKVISIRMLPIELSFNAKVDTKGLPIIADEKLSLKIMKQINRISKLYSGEGKCHYDGRYIVLDL